MYASKTPRDLNTDPFPYRNKYDNSRWRDPGVDTNGNTVIYDPRSEFDREPINENNPILVDLREFWPVIVEDWLAALDDPWFMEGVPKELGVATEDHREHAKKVLTRLAAMS